MFYSSGTSHNRTTHFTTFADQDMLQYAKLCQDMQRYAKIYQETKGKIDYDKGFIHLPRQKPCFCLKWLKIKAFGE